MTGLPGEGAKAVESTWRLRPKVPDEYRCDLMCQVDWIEMHINVAQ